MTSDYESTDLHENMPHKYTQFDTNKTVLRTNFNTPNFVAALDRCKLNTSIRGNGFVLEPLVKQPLKL